MYRPKRVYSNGLPIHKRIIIRLEKLNKVISLRILGKLLKVNRLDRKLNLSEVSSVLFIRYDAFGDMVVTTPLWRILKRLKPSIKIGVAGSRKNLGLLSADKDVDMIYDYSASSLKDFFRITKITRQTKWDLVIMCKFNQKTRGGIISRLSTSNGFNVTIGTPNAEGHQALFSRLIPLPMPQSEMPMTAQLQYLLHSVIDLPEGPFERPTVLINKESEIKTKSKIDSFLLQDNCKKYIVINTEAPEVRKWGIAKNILLAEFIEKNYPSYLILFTSLPENQEIAEQAILSADLKCSHYFPTSDVQELLSVIRYSSLVITPDTGIAHLVSAENKPILGFYPEANEWLPFETSGYIIVSEQGEPISSITVDAAISGASDMLESLQNNTLSGLKIFRCDDPASIEIRK